MSEVSTIINLGVIFFYLVQLFDQKEPKKMSRTSAEQDLKSNPGLLLPLLETQSTPESQLERFCQILHRKWQETVGIVRADMMMICVTIGVLQSTLILTRVLSSLSCDESIPANLARKAIMIAIVLVLVHQNRQEDGSGENQMFVIPLLFLISELVAWQKHEQEMADYARGSANAASTIGLFDVTLFLAAMTLLVKGISWMTRLWRHEKGVSDSQAVVNGLASALFEHKDEGPGLALLQLPKATTAKSDQAVLLRYNHCFSDILLSSNDMNQLHHSADDQTADYACQKQHLTQYFLQSFRRVDNPSGVVAQGRSYEANLENQIHKSVREFRQAAMAVEQKPPQDQFPVLLDAEFECSIDQQSESRRPTIKVCIRVLSFESSLLLVRIKKLKNSKNEVRKIRRVESHEELKSSLKLGSKKSRQAPKKKVSFDQFEQHAELLNLPSQSLDSVSATSTSQMIDFTDQQSQRYPAPKQYSSVAVQTTLSTEHCRCSASSISQSKAQRQRDDSASTAQTTPQMMTSGADPNVMEVSNQTACGIKMKIQQTSQSPNNDRSRERLLEQNQERMRVNYAGQIVTVNNGNLLERAYATANEQQLQSNYSDLMAQHEAIQKKNQETNCIKTDPSGQTYNLISSFNSNKIKDVPQPSSSQLLSHENQALQFIRNVPKMQAMNSAGISSSRESKSKSATSLPFKLKRNFTEGLITGGEERRSSRLNMLPNALELASLRSVTASQKIKNNRVFVYKIIHDLKHPTNALVDGLSSLVDELHLRNDASINFDKKRMKYMSSSNVLKALRMLKNFAKPFQSQIQRNISNQFLPSQVQKLELGNAAAVGNKKINSRFSRREHSSSRRPPNAPTFQIQFNNQAKPQPNNVSLENIADCKEQQSFGQKIQNLRDEFRRLELPQLRQQPIKEEEEKEKNQILINSENKNDASQRVSSSSADSFEINDAISEGHRPIDVPKARTGKQNRNLFDSAEGQHQQEIVRHKSSDEFYRTRITNHWKISKRHQSLALDRLIYTSEIAQQCNTSQSAGLRDINKMIDSMKADSYSLRSNSAASGNVSSFAEHRLAVKSDSPSNHNAISPNGSSLLKLQSKILSVDRVQNDLLDKAQQAHSGDDEHLIQSQNELCNYIMAIINERKFLVSLLEKQIKKQQTATSKVQNLKGQVDMMMTLLVDLMNQAQMANNTFQMVNEYFNCKNLIKRSFRTVAAQSSLKSVNLVGPIFQNPLDRFYFDQLFGDERRYRQFIVNFLSNAIKFSKTDGQVSVHLTVTKVHDEEPEPINQAEDAKSVNSLVLEDAPDKEVHSSDGGDGPLLSDKTISFVMIFRDSGYGISPENKNQLFMNFSKLDENQSANKEGVGLGLSICKEIINANGGSIDIQSELNRGTDFIVTLKTKCRVNEAQLSQAAQKLEEKGQISDEYDTIEKRHEGQSSYESEDYLSSSQYSERQATYELLQAVSIKGTDQVEQQIQVLQQANRENKERIKKLIHEKKHLCTINEYSAGESTSKQYEDDLKKEGNCCKSVCLLANDNPFLLEGYKQGLAPHYDEVVTAQNGREAVDTVKRQARTYFSVIVLDIEMPVMNGMEACLQIDRYLKEEEKVPGPIGSASSMSSELSNSYSMATKIPFIYALTSEQDEEFLKRIKCCGFKQIFHNLDPKMIKVLKLNAAAATQTPQQVVERPPLNLNMQSHEDVVLRQLSAASSQSNSAQSTPIFNCGGHNNKDKGAQSSSLIDKESSSAASESQQQQEVSQRKIVSPIIKVDALLLEEADEGDDQDLSPSTQK